MHTNVPAVEHGFSRDEILRFQHDLKQSYTKNGRVSRAAISARRHAVARSAGNPAVQVSRRLNRPACSSPRKPRAAVSSTLPRPHSCSSSTSNYAAPQISCERLFFLRDSRRNEFTTEGGKLHGAVAESMKETGMLEKSAKVVAAARAKGITVIHAPIMFKDVIAEK